MGYYTTFVGGIGFWPRLSDAQAVVVREILDNIREHAANAERRCSVVHNAYNFGNMESAETSVDESESDAETAARFPHGVGEGSVQSADTAAGSRSVIECPRWCCQWTLSNKSGEWRIEWDQGDKAYDYDRWIHIVVRILADFGYRMYGHILWRGESYTDNGIILMDEERNTVKLLCAQYIEASMNNCAQDLDEMRDGCSWQWPYARSVHEL